MSLIQSIRKNLLYFSITIPLVLIGYEFLMFVTTSNRGWFFLFVGQMLLVPIVYVILSFLFSRIFSGTQYATIVGLVFLVLFSIGITIAISLQGANFF